MDIDPYNMNIRQPDLMGLQKTYAGEYELSQSIWNAAESLSSPHLDVRTAGLDYLEQSKAAFYFPLVVYLLITRLNDPDLMFRARVVKILARTIRPTEQDEDIPEDVRQLLFSSLSQMQDQQIHSLLEIVEFDPTLHHAVAVLLFQCSYAGGHLVRIISKRRVPFGIQRLALQYIGQIGYLDALPVLKRLEKRLLTKIEDGNLIDMDREKGLLSDLKKAIDCLLAP